ncbi:tRNA threonylcarbamoyladenosine biosynthesis protein TsaB [Serratia symbiotica]|nr:tRNA threonylcarbamoyladenosine biosynthesis protein TsaB [Serratia symbiotica]
MSIRILAIDTSTDSCSVAIWNQGEILSLSNLYPRNHEKFILSMIQKLLKLGDFSLTQFNVLAFSCGPGSFTGIRIGMGIIQGLAFGVDLPILGISTLQTMAQGAWRIIGAKYVLSALDAQMGKVYIGKFQRQKDGIWKEYEKEGVFSEKQVFINIKNIDKNWIYVGSGWKKYPHLVNGFELNTYNGKVLLPQAEDILPLAVLNWKKGLAISVENAKLVYLHDIFT